jgi:hypothetical protein
MCVAWNVGNQFGCQFSGMETNSDVAVSFNTVEKCTYVSSYMTEKGVNDIYTNKYMMIIQYNKNHITHFPSSRLNII